MVEKKEECIGCDPLLQPFPGLTALFQLLNDVERSKDAAEQFKNDPSAFLDRYELTDDQKKICMGYWNEGVEEVADLCKDELIRIQNIIGVC